MIFLIVFIKIAWKYTKCQLNITLNDNFRDGVKTHVERVLSYVEPTVENEEVGEAEIINKENAVAANKTVTYSKAKKKKNSEVN